MRLIDADGLIAKYGNWYTEEGTEEGFVGSIKDLIDKIPAIITTEWRWISCKERQPDENDWYLVRLDDGKRAFRWYASDEWERVAGKGDVIAWLPNPEPYKVFEQIVDLMEDTQWQRN